VDAITLSTAQLVNTERLSTSEGWKIILTASLSNLVYQTGAVALLGTRQLLLKIGVCYGIVLLAGLLLLLR
jgi:uncharacterized membrane protein (DUF4010 family)